MCSISFILYLQSDVNKSLILRRRPDGLLIVPISRHAIYSGSITNVVQCPTSSQQQMNLSLTKMIFYELTASLLQWMRRFDVDAHIVIQQVITETYHLLRS